MRVIERERSATVGARGRVVVSRLGRLRAYGAACLAVCLAGCAPAVSLDEPSDDAGAPITSGGPFGPTSGSPGADTLGADDVDEGGSTLDLGAVKLDVAPNDPLPPGMCPPDCQFELNLAWTYDGFVGGSPPPLDPEDQVTVLVEPSDMVVVVQEQQGAVTLARLDDNGQELWTFPLTLPCDPCRVVDVGLHPSGDLLLAGHGVEGGVPVALAARVELDAPELRWSSATVLTPGPGVAPRAGTLVAHDEDLLLQPVLEASLDGLERLELLAYDAATGDVAFTTAIGTGTGTGDAAPPRAAYEASGLLVLTQPAWTDAMSLTGAVRWITAPDGNPVETGERIEPSLRLAAAAGGRVLTVGTTPGPTETLLQLASGYSGDPEQWSLTQPVQTVTSTVPSLVVDTYGDAHVVIRTGQGEPGRERDVELLLLRWSDEGSLIWQLALPVAFDRVNEPVSLQLTFEEHLVLAGFVAGARHVERRIPNCNCG